MDLHQVREQGVCIVMLDPDLSGEASGAMGHTVKCTTRYAMISFNPSITWANSSWDNWPISLPILSVESVRIWLILTHEVKSKLGLAIFLNKSFLANIAINITVFYCGCMRLLPHWPTSIAKPADSTKNTVPPLQARTGPHAQAEKALPSQVQEMPVAYPGNPPIDLSIQR